MSPFVTKVDIRSDKNRKEKKLVYFAERMCFCALCIFSFKIKFAPNVQKVKICC